MGVSNGESIHDINNMNNMCLLFNRSWINSDQFHGKNMYVDYLPDAC